LTRNGRQASATTGRVLVEVDPRYFRPTEVDYLVGDPSKARRQLGWQHRVSFEELVEQMVKHDRKLVMMQSAVGAGNASSSRFAMLNSYGEKPKRQLACHDHLCSVGRIAAKPDIATADTIKKNSRYLLAAVIIAAISAPASAVAACYSYWHVVKQSVAANVVGRPGRSRNR